MIFDILTNVKINLNLVRSIVGFFLCGEIKSLAIISTHSLFKNVSQYLKYLLSNYLRCSQRICTVYYAEC